MLKRQPYDGPSRKLVLGFDIGTSFSGVSYCILEPGETPDPKGVMRFPGTDHLGGHCKIPSILYYDQAGVVQAAGAEADNIHIEVATESHWTKAEWFKLHLCPKTSACIQQTARIPPLPKGKSVVQVFGDFLQYLYRCACDYIEESDRRSTGLEATAEIVLTHPNGWEGGQQELMRQAAIQAGVIPDTPEGRERLFFVPEGEASLHFCVQNGWVTDIERNEGIIILDVGGGTIDVSAYEKTPLSYQEIAPSECSLHGSVFVTLRAEDHFRKIFNGSSLEPEVPIITKIFDRETKLLFSDANATSFIRFGGMRDNFPDLKVKSGLLHLEGSHIEKFFEPTIPAITERIQSLCRVAETKITSVVLVGGFSNSKWLLNKLKTALALYGLNMCRATNHALSCLTNFDLPPLMMCRNKAVAHGAVSFRIDHLVTSRVARYSYGTDCHVPFDSSKRDHTSRLQNVFTDFDGDKCLGGYFDVLLSKNTKVSETKEFRRRYFEVARREEDLNEIKTSIICFRGREQAPTWLDKDKGSFTTLCTVKADLSKVRKLVKYSHHILAHFFAVHFDLILFFGSTEFKGQIAWEENGVEKRGPVQMVYNPDPFIVDF